MVILNTYILHFESDQYDTSHHEYNIIDQTPNEDLLPLFRNICRILELDTDDLLVLDYTMSAIFYVDYESMSQSECVPNDKNHGY